MAKRTVRLPDKIDKKMEEEARRLGISLNEAHIRAVEHFLTCKKAEEVQALKHIPLKYPGTCIKCQKIVEAGEWAFWGKGVGVICSDCEVQKYGDKGTVRRLLKVKELEYQRKVLAKEIEDLLENYGEFSFYEKIQAIHDKNKEASDLLMDYLTKVKVADEEKKFDEVQKAMRELVKLIEETRRFMQHPWKKKKKTQKMVV